jgi:hypothetical protein
LDEYLASYCYQILSPDLFFNRHYIYTFAAFDHIANDHAFRCSKKSVILADIHVQAGQEAGAMLPHNNIAGKHMLTRKHFYTQALGIRIASITAGTAAFFMCHGYLTLYFFSLGFFAAGFLGAAFVVVFLAAGLVVLVFFAEAAPVVLLVAFDAGFFSVFGAVFLAAVAGFLAGAAFTFFGSASAFASTIFSAFLTGSFFTNSLPPICSTDRRV